MNKKDTRILRTLPREKAFYFFTSIGNYTGESASSLEEFKQKINEVNMKCLEFHFHRRDFEKWIAEALEDNKLAENVRKLWRQRPTGDRLRIELHTTISERLSKLIDQSGTSQI